MDYSKEQLTEARRQIDSTVHKLRQTVLTLEAKGDPARYKSQLTLARRRIEAFCLAGELIGRELDKLEQGRARRINAGRFFQNLSAVQKICSALESASLGAQRTVGYNKCRKKRAQTEQREDDALWNRPTP